MDQNRDGFIDKEDLKDTYASLGMCRGAEPRHTPPQNVLQPWRASLYTWALQPDLTSHVPRAMRRWAGSPLGEKSLSGLARASLDAQAQASWMGGGGLGPKLQGRANLPEGHHCMGRLALLPPGLLRKPRNRPGRECGANFCSSEEPKTGPFPLNFPPGAMFSA